MQKYRVITASALSAALAVVLVSSPGCDGSVGDGEQASPINKQESQSQAQAYQNFAKTKKAGKPAGPPKGAEKAPEKPAEKP